MTGYPWASGDELDASDLNAAIASCAPAVALTNADTALTNATTAQTAADAATATANAAQTTANAAMPKVGGTIIATGSTASRTLADRASDVRNVMDFGAVGDGIADDTAAIQAAINSLPSGGTVNAKGKHFVGGNLTLAAGVTLRGCYSSVGAPGASSLSAPYGSLNSIRLAPSATITMSGASTIDGLLVVPHGMAFPQTDSSAWTGTAISVGGNDATVKNSMVIGFGQVLLSSGFDRIRISDCNIDCVSGVSINNSQDTFRINRVHAWPFGTIQSGAGVTPLSRSGTAFHFSNSNDWGKLNECFCYGYQDGFVIDSCESIKAVACGADNVATGNQIGFSVVGTSQDVSLIGCQAAAQETGFYITTSQANSNNRLNDCDAWGNTTHGVLIDTSAVGDVTINGGIIRNSPNGITVASALPKVDIDDVRFEQIGTPATSINVIASTANVRVGPMCSFGSVANGNPIITSNAQLNAVASASTMLLPATGSRFFVSGTTNIGEIAGGWAGREVSLVFEGALTVFNGGTAPNGTRLAANASYTASNNSTLVLLHTGSTWVQIGGIA